MCTTRELAVLSRRAALGVAGAGLAATVGSRLAPGSHAQEATPVSDPTVTDSLSVEILQTFRMLPGTHDLKVWAPAMAGGPEWSVAQNPDEQMFIASAFKGFVLAEALRQVEAAADPAAALQQLLPLDESVFSLDSSVFNPPHLTGEVSLRTALEAMISHSDNTGADIVLRHIGAASVQAFIDDIGLTHTRIPTSTRQFIGYIMGLPDWQNTTWAQLEAGQFPDPRPIINDTITMASSAADLVSFYSRSLTGELFQRASTLATFRTTLTMADAVPMAIPLGADGFGKGGAISANGHHALTFAGGLYVPDRWLYFALLLNWTDTDGVAAEIQGAYVEAARRIFTLVRDAFTR
jgi:beta-lactamase class A